MNNSSSVSRFSLKVRKLKGFTLLELIVVIAIMGILASIIIPNTVSRVRDARIESANATAKDIYFAVQNYCTDMQIRKIPLIAPAGENAAFPFSHAEPILGNPKDGRIAVGYVGGKSDAYNSVDLVLSTSDRDVADKTIANPSAYLQSNPDCVWGFVKNAKMGTVVSSDINGTGNNQNKGGRAITGITNYLGSSLGATQVGAFIAMIDTNTYSVDFVVFSEQPTALVDCQTVIGNIAQPYTQVFGRPAYSGAGKETFPPRSQEYDTLGKGKYYAPYVGQYPIYSTNGK